MGLTSPPATGVVGQLKDKSVEAAEFLKKLGNPNRLMIVCALAEGEKSVGELETQLGIRQPALSQQLAELREAGLIVGKRAVKQVRYSLASERARALVGLVYQLFCEGRANGWSPAPVAARPKRTQNQAAVFARAHPYQEQDR